MKQLRIAIPILIIVIVTIACMWYKNNVTDIREQKIAAIQKNDALNNEKKKQLIKEINALEEKKGRKITFKEMLSLLPNKARKYYRLAATGNMSDITFYGKVVDQYGEPIAGATVELGSGGSYLAGGRGWAQRTDQQGRFKAEVEGSSIFIQKVTHPSIHYKEPLGENGKAIGSYFGFASYDNYRWKDYNSPENAFVLKAWRVEKMEAVERGEVNLVVEPDERNYTITFYDHYVKHGRNYVKSVAKEGKHPGHLRVRAYVDPIPEGIRYVDAKAHWWFELEAIGGGLIEVPTDVYLNLAPEEGYQPLIRVEAFADGLKGPHEFRNKRYYFNTENGETYGSVKIHYVGVTGPNDNRPAIGIEYKFNPNASRNLTLSPSRHPYK